jgi:AraC-like DNA-binding protein
VLLSNEGFRRLIRARERLSEFGEVSVSVAAVAREVGVSPFHFIRQFEAVFGVTPHEFRIQARLEAARRLLALDRASVTDVCMEVGFSSLGSFSALFTRRVGETPSAYRQRIRMLRPKSGTPASALTPGCLTLMQHLPPDAFADRNFREA